MEIKEYLSKSLISKIKINEVFYDTINEKSPEEHFKQICTWFKQGKIHCTHITKLIVDREMTINHADLYYDDLFITTNNFSDIIALPGDSFTMTFEIDLYKIKDLLKI